MSSFTFLVNYTSGSTEKRILKLNEERWILEWIYNCYVDTEGYLRPGISATISVMEENKIERIGIKPNYCEIIIGAPEWNEVLGRSRKYLENGEKLSFVFEISNNYIKPVKLSVIFGYDDLYVKSLLEGTLNCMQEGGTLTDFVIETEYANIPCHKMVLAARSDYFKNMFETGMKESSENVLHWERVFDESTVQDLLHFIYTADKPPNISITRLSLFEAARVCMLEDLKEMCIQEIIRTMTTHIVVKVLVMSEKYESDTLKHAALNFLVDNLEDVEGDVTDLPGWDKVEPAMEKNLMVAIIKILVNEKV